MNDSVYAQGLDGLRILIYLAGIIVCFRNLAVSRWIKLILIGFVGMLAAHAASRTLTCVIWQAFQKDTSQTLTQLIAIGFCSCVTSVLEVFSLGLVVLGLGIFLWEYKRR